ncbi:ATPase [Marinococcus halophilus]|uniref:ATPase n=1 Tax=Marinococcus halophilus TaxID=1371 RepID=A0A510Y9Y4_MARHA|nr:FGGY-family carbohydrate kinase [Marinococcus halophilus]OZT78838.1 ATPase [Marinococcus halophilus]GEK60185.1 ATPase [Marinococcus halophilus]
MNQSGVKQAITQGETSLGIEFGSTRIKAVLIDNNSKTIATGSYEWENQLENDFWTYNQVDIITGLQAAYSNMKFAVESKYGVTIRTIGSIGVSAMMHGYMPFDRTGELLVPFRTWRNNTTSVAASELTDLFQYNIPERWSIAHLYQAILDDEKHLPRIHLITTLSGYIHWLLTGKQVLGAGDASGMFPFDETTQDYNKPMLNQFDSLITSKNYPWKVKDILPKTIMAGEQAGTLTNAGIKILDRSQNLQPGIPFCPPEGDAGTGMVATNSVRKHVGNISVGTSVFAMIVLEQKISNIHQEIDLVATPSGNPVAMVHANNCSSDLDAWLGLFREFSEALGQKLDSNELFEVMLEKALDADPDGGGLLSYGYFSGENITGLESGRPLFVRSPESNFNLANFMRTHLFSAFGALKIGMDLLTKEEDVAIHTMFAHGGLFKTPVVGQKIVAAVMNAPVSVMNTAGEGGAWGIAVLASYMKNKERDEALEEFLDQKVFNEIETQEIHPDRFDVEGFKAFMERYKNGLAIEQTAVDYLTPTNLKEDPVKIQ